MKHTPGPWSINNYPHANADMSVGAIGTPRIAVIPLRDVSINEQKANATLIAAAPAMLEALEAIANNRETGDLAGAVRKGAEVAAQARGEA